MKIKKIISLVLSCTILISSVSVFANEITHETNRKENSNYELEYQYERNDLVIESNTEIDSSEVDFLYDLANGNLNRNNKNSNSNITPFAVPADSVISGAIMVAGPKRNTYKNDDAKLIAESITAWALSKIPKIGKSAALVTWLSGKLKSLSDKIKPTYVESWVYKQYIPEVKKYRAYVTIVHHANSSFNKPIKVQHYSPGYYN